MERKLTAIAALVACAVALLLPALHFASAYRAQHAIIVTEAEINARLATQLVNANPELWRFETHRFENLLARRPKDGTLEIRAVYEADGRVVARVADQKINGPLVSTRAVLYDAGTAVGELEITRSLRPLLYTTGLVLLFAIALASAVYAALRVFPLRALNAAMDSLVQERERGAASERAKKVAEAAAEAKAQFLANMSHEIRTPLNGVLGLTEVMLQSPLDGEQRRLAETIYRSGETLMRVINDILDFSKIEAGKLELHESAFDVRELLEDVAALLAPAAHKNGLEFVCDLADELPTRASADSGRLRQVLTNLIGNAIKFTERGEIVLSAHVQSETYSHVRLQVEVRDTGIGMHPSTIGRIFEPFTQAEEAMSRRFGGTGLGLSITRQLIELMGGSISVASEVGTGSTFRIELPLRTLERETLATSDVEAVVPGKRILLVAGNQAQRGVLERQLASLGAEVTSANDAKAALAVLRDECGAQRGFDIAVVDAQLPGVSGLDFARTLKSDASFGRVKLLLLVTADSAAALRDAAACGVQAHVTKPPPRKLLREALRSVLTAAHAAERTGDAAAKQVPLHRPTSVLLAEDNATNRLVATSMLRKAGLHVQTAENGIEAVTAASEHAFDLVLMDCQMPEMDGFQATAAIREREAQGLQPRLPVIALTANAMAGDRERCLAAGFDDYLAKPFKQADLLGIIERWSAPRA